MLNIAYLQCNKDDHLQLRICSCRILNRVCLEYWILWCGWNVVGEGFGFYPALGLAVVTKEKSCLSKKQWNFLHCFRSCSFCTRGTEDLCEDLNLNAAAFSTLDSDFTFQTVVTSFHLTLKCMLSFRAFIPSSQDAYTIALLVKSTTTHSLNQHPQAQGTDQPLESRVSPTNLLFFAVAGCRQVSPWG